MRKRVWIRVASFLLSAGIGTAGRVKVVKSGKPSVARSSPVLVVKHGPNYSQPNSPFASQMAAHVDAANSKLEAQLAEAFKQAGFQVGSGTAAAGGQYLRVDFQIVEAEGCVNVLRNYAPDAIPVRDGTASYAGLGKLTVEVKFFDGAGRELATVRAKAKDYALTRSSIRFAGEDPEKKENGELQQLAQEVVKFATSRLVGTSRCVTMRVSMA